MEIPTREEFYEIVNRAKDAGQTAAKKKYEDLMSKTEPGKYNSCGDASLVLTVDGRTKMGKFIRSLINNPLPNLCVYDDRYNGYILDIVGMAPYQEMQVCEAAERAALEVFKESLGVRGRISARLD
jgi:hypothetical protein